MICRIAVVLTLITLTTVTSFGQDSPDRKGIDKAKKDLENEINAFASCMLDSDLKTCVSTLVSKARNEYEKYIIGGLLFNVDEKQSFQLHESAYKANSKNVYFILEYALELHRAGRFAEAIPLYEKYHKEMKDDYRAYVWLSECNLNIGKTEKAIEYWKMSNHADHHTGIDFAIHIVHGMTDQFQRRDQYRRDVVNGNTTAAYQLIFMDLNWVQDWWNSDVNKEFLKADLKLLDKTFKSDDVDYKTIRIYEKSNRGLSRPRIVLSRS